MWSTNDIARATAKMTWGAGNEINNVFQFAHSGDSASDTEGQEDLLDFLDTLYDAYNTQVMNTIAYTTINVMNVTQERVFGEAPWPTLTVGLYANTDVPHGACALVTLRTGYSHSVGRKYVAGGSEGYLNAGAWTTSFINGLIAAYSVLLAPFVGSVSGTYWVPGIATLTHGFRPFTSIAVSTEPAYQRRRRRGTGS